jgi:excisionase family DNA binding protein
VPKTFLKRNKLCKKLNVIPANEVIDFERGKTEEKHDEKFMYNPYLRSQKWLTGDEVIHLLGVSKRTLQNYRDQRILPFSQSGRKIYYKASDIEAYLEAHYIKSFNKKGVA